MKNLTIRLEQPEDHNAILRLTYEAFLTLDYPGRRRIDEHPLIHLWTNSASVIRDLCIVAENDGEIIGHILYTGSKFKRPDGTEADTVTFGPVSVLPKHQKKGIGKTLISHSIEKARDMGYGAVLIVGVPDYYPKLGFKRASDDGLVIGGDGLTCADQLLMADAFMTYELKPGYLKDGGVFHFLAPEYDRAENDDEGYDVFNKLFMAENFPNELTLRPFFDNDIVLMNRWLYAGHVSPWYEHQEDWMNELRERRGEFLFISHFIAEHNGVPIGFCQYYDMFDGQEHENWVKTSARCSLFSIDYLIGEPEYLHLGLGQKMIAELLSKLRKKGVKSVIVRPEKENFKSNRTIEASGFKWDGNNYMLDLRQPR